MSHAPPAPRQHSGLQMSFLFFSLNTSVMCPWLHSNDGLLQSDLLGLRTCAIVSRLWGGVSNEQQGGGDIIRNSPENTQALPESEDVDRQRWDCVTRAPPVRCCSVSLLDGGVKPIQFKPHVTSGQPSVTGGLGKPEEVLGDTNVGPTLHHCQEDTNGQGTSLSICESPTVPLKASVWGMWFFL